jgi:hypothetical protein
MSDPPICLDFAQTRDVLLDLTTKRTFHNVIAFEQCSQTTKFILSQITSLSLRVDAGIATQITSSLRTNTI